MPHLRSWRHKKNMGLITFMLFPYILFQDLQLFCSQNFPIAKKCKFEKGSITRLNIFRILSKVTWAIYTLDPNSIPNIISLSQAVFTRFPFSHKALSPKRGITQLNIFGILSKVNQVIYTLDPNYMPNIMSLAQPALQIFCS